MFLLLWVCPHAFAADADELTRLQQQVQALMQQMMQCADDVCRVNVQKAMADLADRISRAAQAGGDATPPQERMQLPQASTVAPDGESWDLALQSSWTANAPAAAAHSVLEGTVSLRADKNGVFTGSGVFQALFEFGTVPTGCHFEPLTGDGTVEVAGLRDGDFLWLWTVPGEPIRTVGRASCTVLNVTTTHENEIFISPEEELMMAFPVLMERRVGNELVSTGNARGNLVVGAAVGSVQGEFVRHLRLVTGARLREVLPPPADPKRHAESSWRLEYALSSGGFEQLGEVTFVAPEGGGRVRGRGELRGQGQGIVSSGRLLLDGQVDDVSLRFIPRGVLDDVVTGNAQQNNLAQMWFNVLFVPGDQHVTLPLENGATLTQGPVTWRLHNNNPCKVAITAPKKDQRYRFDAATPGKLSIQFAAQAQPAKYNKRIKWTLPSFGTSKVTLTPKNAEGPKLTVTLEGLPKRNSDLGDKTVAATLLVPGGCSSSDKRRVKLFFPRDARNNPDGKVPNWFYYWSQTKARFGPLPTYGARSGHCGKPANKAVPDNYGYYSMFRSGALSSTYVICDLTKAGRAMPYDMPLWSVTIIQHQGKQALSVSESRTALTGIDTFGATSLHENEHMTHLRKWWLAPNGAPIDRITRRQRDTDADDIPDSVEAALNKKYQGGVVLRVGSKATNAGISDEEFFTQLSHGRWTPGAASTEDWAHPGHQWTK